jgi:hypothetical protein
MNSSEDDDLVSDTAAGDAILIGAIVFVVIYFIGMIITTIFASKAVTNFNTKADYTYKDLTIASIVVMWVTPFSFIGFVSSIVFAIIGNTGNYK